MHYQVRLYAQSGGRRQYRTYVPVPVRLLRSSTGRLFVFFKKTKQIKQVGCVPVLNLVVAGISPTAVYTAVWGPETAVAGTLHLAGTCAPYI